MGRILMILAACLCLCGMGTPQQSAAAEAKNMQTLNPKQQSIVTIAAFTAKGDMEKLAPALHKGLDAGLTVNEIKEVLVQLYAYCGFPRSLNALGNFMAVLEARKATGVHDPAGAEASPLAEKAGGKTRLELGTENQTKLAGAPVKGALFEFAPAIDAFLKDHLFGDIFGRDNLDWPSREIATVAALASLDGVQSQLRAHIGISMNTGLSEAQLHSLSEGLRATVGAKEGDNAAAALQAVVQQRKK